MLSRRTKNNPVLVGEPGVGKTALKCLKPAALNLQEYRVTSLIRNSPPPLGPP